MLNEAGVFIAKGHAEGLTFAAEVYILLTAEKILK